MQISSLCLYISIYLRYVYSMQKNYNKNSLNIVLLAQYFGKITTDSLFIREKTSFRAMLC